MTNHTKLKQIALLPVFLLCIGGCGKYLEEKPDRSLVVPSTLKDLQSLLDNNQAINTMDNYILGESSSDNYYLSDASWSSLNIDYRNTYVWADNIISTSNLNNEWLILYKQVNIANTVLDEIQNMDRTTENSWDWDNIRGSALFYRSFFFSTIVFNWANAYDSTTAKTDMGIPLGLQSDFNIPTTRPSVEQTYLQMVKDLKDAVTLLADIPSNKMRPSKPAAYALLSRILLSMGKYSESLTYADSCLKEYNHLLSYNTLTSKPGEYYSFPMFNEEVIFHSQGYSVLLDNYTAKIDSTFYLTYNNNDLRKSMYFFDNSDGSKAFKGSYTGDYSIFTGLAADEMYLNKAECLARMDNVQGAMDTLNLLLATRWQSGTFQPFVLNNKDAVLKEILAERRKELVMRNLRWMDIKRLNKNGEDIEIRRKINSLQYVLSPHSNKFALPIPEYVIEQSGIKQNPR